MAVEETVHVEQNFQYGLVGGQSKNEKTFLLYCHDFILLYWNGSYLWSGYLELATSMTERISLEEHLKLQDEVTELIIHSWGSMSHRIIPITNPSFAKLVEYAKNSKIIIEKGYKDANELLNALGNSREETIRLEIQIKRIMEYADQLKRSHQPIAESMASICKRELNYES